MDCAIVENGLVINVTVWNGDPTWQPPDGCDMIPLTPGAGIGWGYVNGEFTPPPQPEPEPEPELS